MPAAMSFEIPKAELGRLKRNCIKNAVEANRDLSVEIRQRALNVTGRIFDYIPPESGPGVEAKRFEVRKYLGQQMSTAIKMAKRGKRAGRFMRKGGRGRQLIRANLIVQARRARQGKKGLYGEQMAAVTGTFRATATKSVGFLKSPFLPIIVTLNGLCRFKFPFNKTRNISRWPKSAGFGWAKVIPSATSPMVLINAQLRTRTNAGKIQNTYNKAAGRAIADENAEIEKHMRERKEKMRAKLKLI